MMNGQLDRLKSFINSESKDDKIRIIGFLSGMKENGKSFCLYNHALSISKNKKILIIDLFRTDFNFLTPFSKDIYPKIKNVLYQIQKLEEKLSVAFVEESDLNNPYFLKNLFKTSQNSEKHEIIFLNSLTGSYDNIISISMAAEELFIVCTPDPVSIMDAYASIKILLRKGIDKKIKIVINKVKNEEEFYEASENLKKAVSHFLKHDLDLFSMVPYLDDGSKDFLGINAAFLLLENKAILSESFLGNGL